MKKITFLFLITILFSSCGVSIKSVVDSSAIKEPYKNPLIVIPYEYSTKNFSERLEEKLEEVFDENQQKIDIVLFERNKKELTLNEDNNLDQIISNSINKDNKDLLLIFRPTNLEYYNGGIQSATYELVGIDTKTKKEVWKASFNSSSSFGPALFAEKSAKKIYEKLKMDKVL